MKYKDWVAFLIILEQHLWESVCSALVTAEMSVRGIQALLFTKIAPSNTDKWIGLIFCMIGFPAPNSVGLIPILGDLSRSSENSILSSLLSTI